MKKLLLLLLMSVCVVNIAQGLMTNSQYQQFGQGHFANDNQSVFDLSGLDNPYLLFDGDWGTYTNPTWHGLFTTLGGFIQEYYVLDTFAYNISLVTEGWGSIVSGRDCSYVVYLWNWNTSHYELVVNETSGVIVNTTIPVADQYILNNGSYVIKQWTGGDYKLGWCATTLYESMLGYEMYPSCQGDICCRYDRMPALKKDIDWSCTTSQFAQCIVGIFKGDDLLSVSPSAQSVRDVGVVQYMDAQNGLLNFRLDTKDLYPKSNYTVRVFCHSNTTTSTYTGVIEPVFTDLRELPALAVQWKENMAYVIFVALCLIAIIFIYSIAKK